MSELSEFRYAKDSFFRTGNSPLTEEQKRAFTGLNYYEERPELAFDLEVEEFEAPETVELQTSTGDNAAFLRWGRVTFPVAGRQASLIVFRDPGTDSYFLPFQDANRGRETYGAGRYLDIEALPGGKLRLDFNYAYNPYCAYNDEWSCPLPPPENRLDVPIEAGEKMFHPE